MSHLDDLHRQRAALDEKIRLAERSLEQQKKRMTLEASYVKVVCDDCSGTGEISVGGADVLSDPVFSDTCPQCHGDGFLYARKFEGQHDHDMEYHQVSGNS